jgi:AraC-like DNA-binding protein
MSFSHTASQLIWVTNPAKNTAFEARAIPNTFHTPKNTRTFRSAEENEEALLRMGVNQEMRQLRRGPFQSDLAARTTPTAELFADRFSTACRMYLEPPPGMVGLLWLRSAGGPLLASGVDVANDKLLFVPKSNVVGLVTPDLAGSQAVVVPEDRFNEMLAAFCPECGPLECVSLIEGDTASLRALSRTVLSLLREPGEDLHPERLSNLLAATFSWIGESEGRWPPEKLRVHSVQRRIAKQAEEFICEHYRDAVNLEDVCRETGVGLRSLQRSVRAYFDVTITELLESVRMEAAHRDLSKLRLQESTVTNVALDNGFTHLGRFSVAFHQRYGEKPSEVLARRSG